VHSIRFSSFGLCHLVQVNDLESATCFPLSRVLYDSFTYLFTFTNMSCQFFENRGLNLLETYLPQACVPALPGKRPRQQDDILSGLSYIRDGDRCGMRDSKQWLTRESHDIILKDALQFARWSKALAKSHNNCKRIPVDLVLRMAVRMIRYVLSRIIFFAFRRN
jgi:hypothetical protein